MSGPRCPFNGLPDIGDPFDVAAFRSFRLPDDQNAFTYLRRASEKLTNLSAMVGWDGSSPGDLKFSWSIANPTMIKCPAQRRRPACPFPLPRKTAEIKCLAQRRRPACPFPLPRAKLPKLSAWHKGGGLHVPSPFPAQNCRN